MKKRSNWLILAGILSWFSYAFSSDTGFIAGKVTDATTGEGLMGVEILIVGNQIGTATATDGIFQIENLIPGKYRLRFTSLGYKTVHIEQVTVRAGEKAVLQVVLEQVPLRGDEIVVTAARRPQLSVNTPDITFIQTAEEIRILGASQVDEVLQYLPGVSSMGGTGSGQPFKRTISLNGMPAYYSLILVDGMRVLSSHIHTGADVNVVPPENIERIEMVKGAISAQYGSDGIGGVINIITRSGSQQPGIILNSYGGSRNTFHQGLSVTGSIDSWFRHSLFSSWDQSDGIPIIEPVFRKDRLSYTMFHLMDKMEFDIASSLKAMASIHYLNTQTPYRQSPLASWMLTPSLSMEYALSQESTLQVSGYYSQWNSQQNNELNEIASPEVLVSYAGWKNHYLLFGSEYLYRNFARTRVAEQDQYSSGFFVQDEFSATSDWQFLAALRLDKVENIAPVVSPKLSALFRVNEDISLRASLGRGFRAPSVQDLYETLYSHPGNIHYRAGNPDLKPEYSTSLNAGIDWQAIERISFILNGYYYAIDNMITPVDHGLEDPTIYFSPDQIPFVTDSLVYIYRRENIHQGMILGGELKFLWYFLPGYSIESGFTYTYNENKTTGKSLPYYPGNHFSLLIQGKQSLNPHIYISGFIGLNSVMERKIWRFQHDGEQQIDLKDFQKLDAGLNLNFRDRFELYFNVDNILGEELNLYEDVNFVVEGTPLFRIGLRLQTD